MKFPQLNNFFEISFFNFFLIPFLDFEILRNTQRKSTWLERNCLTQAHGLSLNSKAQTLPVHTTPWSRFCLIAFYCTLLFLSYCIKVCSIYMELLTFYIYITLLTFYRWQYTWTVTLLQFYHWQYTWMVTLLPFYQQHDSSFSPNWAFSFHHSFFHLLPMCPLKCGLIYASSLQSKTLLLIHKVLLALNFILEKGMMQGSKRID